FAVLDSFESPERRLDDFRFGGVDSIRYFAGHECLEFWCQVDRHGHQHGRGCRGSQGGLLRWNRDAELPGISASPTAGGESYHRITNRTPPLVPFQSGTTPNATSREDAPRIRFVRVSPSIPPTSEAGAPVLTRMTPGMNAPVLS